MKITALLTICATAFCLTQPVIVDLVGSDGTTVYPDSAFLTVIASGETLLSWSAMDTVGRSAHYDWAFPETIWSATAIVAAFWEDSLRDTTAFAIPNALNPDLVARFIEDTLSTSHGNGSWENKCIMPFLLTMSEEEYVAMMGGAARKPISVYRGDSKKIDFTVLDSGRDTVDITNGEAIFTIRSGESDETALISDTLTIENGPAGKMRLSLSSSQTEILPRSYAADIQLSLPDSTVATVWRSRFIVKWDVTR